MGKSKRQPHPVWSTQETWLHLLWKKIQKHRSNYFLYDLTHSVADLRRCKSSQNINILEAPYDWNTQQLPWFKRGNYILPFKFFFFLIYPLRTWKAQTQSNAQHAGISCPKLPVAQLTHSITSLQPKQCFTRFHFLTGKKKYPRKIICGLSQSARRFCKGHCGFTKLPLCRDKSG